MDLGFFVSISSHIRYISVTHDISY